jgi:CheY-like chemotaxis protein
MLEGRIKILVVEDEENMRQALAELLRLDGFEVVTARDGEDGYRQALLCEPDMIITDLVMPILDGLELSRLIRRQPGRVRTVPILALSANLPDYHLTSRMTSGIDRFLSKPVSDYQSLVTTIRSLLEVEQDAALVSNA